ncbi:hypothetical protein SKAU_G00229150 [Synaphobranchus kaupii]|uniref:Uncharacterized protein n=1 Tax=Synaphobranchus kaupii TaxID=118154 RepID=A0A9Q1F5B1_SYNKA|nr:hypothetical protein SKAU_G00229150 [Synaphobranchus kaupii]
MSQLALTSLLLPDPHLTPPVRSSMCETDLTSLIKFLFTRACLVQALTRRLNAPADATRPLGSPWIPRPFREPVTMSQTAVGVPGMLAAASALRDPPPPPPPNAFPPPAQFPSIPGVQLRLWFPGRVPSDRRSAPLPAASRDLFDLT